MVFDIPNHQGTYKERYSLLGILLTSLFYYLLKITKNNNTESKLSNTGCPFLEVAPKITCNDEQHLESFFQDIIDEGGEGVILRDPNCPLVPGRSPGFLKHKVTNNLPLYLFANYPFTSIRNIETQRLKLSGQPGYMNGNANCKSIDFTFLFIGSLSFLFPDNFRPNGITFIAGPGTSEFLKRYAPKPGDIVSFKHSGYFLGSKQPKYPSLYRVRTDVTWENVIQSWKDNKFTSSEYPIAFEHTSCLTTNDISQNSASHEKAQRSEKANQLLAKNRE